MNNLVLSCFLIGLALSSVYCLKDCKDKNAKCPGWRRYCNDGRFRRYMKKHCKATCDQCPNRVCKDRNVNCPNWLSYCNSNPYVKKYCKATCGRCPNLVCKDRHVYCPYWQHFCKSYTFVKKFCKATCGLCPNPGPTTPVSAKATTPTTGPTTSGSAKATTPTTGPTTSGSAKATTPTTESGLKADCLKFHNEKRKLHGAPDLVWDETLAKQSQQWADGLAKNGTFKHGEGNFGENLYKSMGSKVSCEDAVNLWYNEIQFYDFETGKANKNDSVIGHFTQVVWKSSTSLGVGLATNGATTVIVARYLPPGNYKGKYKENVLPKI